MAVFRSVMIPLKAAVLNLLSVGASLGLLTLVFQEGLLARALGVEPGPIEAFLPVMIFAIVFGLSMDYEMFLISRMREEWQSHHDAPRDPGRDRHHPPDRGGRCRDHGGGLRNVHAQPRSDDRPV